MTTSHHDNTSGFLDFFSRNNEASETILLIHGAQASGKDWDLVEPHLTSYHLLIPSLFVRRSLELARNLTSSQLPATKPSGRPQWQARYVKLLADMIQAHAKNGRAHIVGLSLGGCFAIGLASAYPELTSSIFVSGLPALIDRPSKILRSCATGGLWVLEKWMAAMGYEKLGWFLESEVKISAGGWDGQGGGATSEMVEIMVDTVAGGYPLEAFPLKDWEPLMNTVDHNLQAQALAVRIVAATRRSKWTPTGDSAEWATKAGKMFSDKASVGDESRQSVKTKTRLDVQVYEAKEMFHPWSRQDPALFASCIVATVQGNSFSTEDMAEIWRL